MPELKDETPSGRADDAEVIRNVLDGAVDDFELLVSRYRDKVGRIAAARVRPDDVEEVAHEIFVRAFKSLGSYGGKAPFENWISKMDVHCCHDYWRARHREMGRFASPGEGIDYQVWLERVATVSGEKDFQAVAEVEDTRRVLEMAMGRLDGDERWLMESYYYEDMPLKDAAATLGWSLVKTKVKAMRARHKLRKAIDGLIREGGTWGQKKK